MRGILHRFENTRYESRIRELLDDAECTVIEQQLIFAPIAGANDVIKLHYVRGDVVLPNARLLIAELPDDEPWHEMTTALLANGFREEGRINDFVADGIALRLLVRRSE